MPGVDVLHTWLLSAGDLSFVAQPWECGPRFELNDLAHHDDLVSNSAYMVMTAFSHFTYQNTNHQSVYVDFQGKYSFSMTQTFHSILLSGFKTTSGYKILDSRTHIR